MRVTSTHIRSASLAPTLTARELDDIYSLRVLVEATGIRLTLPTLGGDEAAALAELADEMDRCSRRSCWHALTRADRAFHLALVAGGGPRIRNLTAELCDQTGALESALPPRAETTCAALREHRRMLACALEQDVEGCTRALAEHHLRTAVELAAAFDPEFSVERVKIAAVQVTNPRTSALDAV